METKDFYRSMDGQIKGKKEAGQSRYRFSVESVRYKEEERLLERKFIALKDMDTGIVAAHTNFADYIVYRGEWDIPINVCKDGNLYSVAAFLNYAFFDRKKRKIKKLSSVTKGMIQEYLDQYANTKKADGTYPAKKTVFRKRDALCVFFYMACRDLGKEIASLKAKDLMTVSHRETAQGLHGKKFYDYRIFVKFNEGVKSELKRLNRDMPLSIIPLFVKMAQIHDPQLAFAIVLSAYGG